MTRVRDYPRRLSGLGWGVGLFALGLALRLPGLLFNGMLDLDEIMFVWGAEVHAYGLAAAFKINYGLFSYALYGLFFSLAEQAPRFWWAPYKLGEIVFEALVALALYQLLPPRWRWAAWGLYWLNPWFILHGAWQGFWEGPHVWLGLLAVLALRRVRDERAAWWLVGLCLMSSAMFKPQGLAYFVVPVGLYLGVQLLGYGQSALLWYVGGVASVVAAGTAWIVLLGGKVTALADNYLSAVGVMPNLCNGCVGGWRTVAWLLQRRLGQGGPTYELRLPAWLDTPLHLAAALATLAFLLLLCLRVPLPPRVPLPLYRADRQPRPVQWLVGLRAALQGLLGRVFGPLDAAQLTSDGVLLLVLAYASLAVAQIGTRAHINHTYTALVLLIPLVVGRRWLLVGWLSMVAVQFYAHLATYLVGRPVVLPQFLRDPAPPQPLISAIQQALAVQPYDRLLQVQGRANDLITGALPIEPVVALFSLAHAVWALYTLLRLLQQPTAPASDPATVQNRRADRVEAV